MLEKLSCKFPDKVVLFFPFLTLNFYASSSRDVRIRRIYNQKLLIIYLVYFGSLRLEFCYENKINFYLRKLKTLLILPLCD